MRRSMFAILLGLTISTSAWSQMSLDADTDGDGAISLAELREARTQAVERHFAELDTDADGFLREDEIRAGRGRGPRPGRLRQELSRIDADGDGAWSFAELQAVRPELSLEQFNRLDINGDGLIGEDERAARRRNFGGPAF